MGLIRLIYLLVYMQCNICTFDNFLFVLNNVVLLQSMSHTVLFFHVY